MRVTDEQLKKLIDILWDTISYDEMIGGLTSRDRLKLYNEIPELKEDQKLQDRERVGQPYCC